MKTGAIAQQIDKPASTTTELIQEMAKLDLVVYEKYYPVKLAKKGQDIADQIKRSHQILEVFFVNQLQLDLDFACEQAIKLEAIVDPLLIIQLCSWLNHPNECPHGHPISDPCRPTKEPTTL